VPSGTCFCGAGYTPNLDMTECEGKKITDSKVHLTLLRMRIECFENENIRFDTSKNTVWQIIICF